jgi:hypothetical protein
MEETLRCRYCDVVIGVHEPMIQFRDGEARETTAARSAAEEHTPGECYHRSCYARAYSQTTGPEAD